MTAANKDQKPTESTKVLAVGKATEELKEIPTSTQENSKESKNPQTLLDSAKSLLINEQFEQAADLYAEALTLLEEESKGKEKEQETDPDPAVLYHYGKALLGCAIAANSVLGEKAEEMPKNAPVDEKAPANPKFVFDDDNEDDDEEEEEEETALQDVDVPTDDLQLAWQNLDHARILLNKGNLTEEQMLLKGDIHIALGDVSLEGEMFEDARSDYWQAVELKKAVKRDDMERELAEVYFKYALACEYGELYEEAIDGVKFAMKCLEDRINQGKDVEILKGFIQELDLKLQDIQLTLKKEEVGEEVGSSSKTMPATINDVSSLVKNKRKPVAEETLDAKKPKMEDSKENAANE